MIYLFKIKRLRQIRLTRIFTFSDCCFYEAGTFMCVPSFAIDFRNVLASFTVHLHFDE